MKEFYDNKYEQAKLHTITRNIAINLDKFSSIPEDIKERFFLNIKRVELSKDAPHTVLKNKIVSELRLPCQETKDLRKLCNDFPLSQERLKEILNTQLEVLKQTKYPPKYQERVEEVKSKINSFGEEKTRVERAFEQYQQYLNNPFYKDVITHYLKELINQNAESVFKELKDSEFLVTNLDLASAAEELSTPKAELEYLLQTKDFTGLVIGCGHDNIPRDITIIFEACNIPAEVSIGCSDLHKSDLCITRSPDDCVLNADITDIDASDIGFWQILAEVLNGRRLSHVKDHTLLGCYSDKASILAPEVASYIKDNILAPEGHLYVAIDSNHEVDYSYELLGDIESSS
jgi:hypothetical protein